MKIVNLNQKLVKAKFDPKVSIKRICLAENKQISYHVAEIKNQVNAHVHKKGDEFYHIMKGNGLIYFGKIKFNNNKVISVKWSKSQKVKIDDVFNIPTGFAHCLKNLDKKPLIISFVCPPQHLLNDRFIVKNPF